MLKVLNNRLIAFLDVLGFSAKLHEMDTVDLYEQYKSFIQTAKTATFFQATGDNEGRTNFEFSQILSDSIILVSNQTDDPYSVNHFIMAIAFLLEEGFRSNMPLRGAITYGDFLVDDEENIFLSKQLAQAVKLEGEQDWSGCFITKEAEKLCLESLYGISELHQLSDQIGNQIALRYPVPLKHGQIADALAINFMFSLSGDQINNAIAQLIPGKREHNQAFFDFVANLPHEAQELPEEFRPAVFMLPMKTRTGIKLKFIDEDRRPCEPGVKEFHISAIGRWY